MALAHLLERNKDVGGQAGVFPMLEMHVLERLFSRNTVQETAHLMN